MQGELAQAVFGGFEAFVHAACVQQLPAAVIGPAMVGTDKFTIGFMALRFVANARTPVAADIEQGAYLAIGIPGD